MLLSVIQPLGYEGEHCAAHLTSEWNNRREPRLTFVLFLALCSPQCKTASPESPTPTVWKCAANVREQLYLLHVLWWWRKALDSPAVHPSSCQVPNHPTHHPLLNPCKAVQHPRLHVGSGVDHLDRDSTHFCRFSQEVRITSTPPRPTRLVLAACWSSNWFQNCLFKALLAPVYKRYLTFLNETTMAPEVFWLSEEQVKNLWWGSWNVLPEDLRAAESWYLIYNTSILSSFSFIWSFFWPAFVSS